MEESPDGTPVEAQTLLTEDIREENVLTRIEVPLPLGIVKYATFKKQVDEPQFSEAWYRLGMSGGATFCQGPWLVLDPSVATSWAEIKYYFPDIVVLQNEEFLSTLGLFVIHPSRQVTQGMIRLSIQRQLSEQISRDLPKSQIQQIDPTRFQLEVLYPDANKTYLEDLVESMYKLLMAPNLPHH